METGDIKREYSPSDCKQNTRQGEKAVAEVINNV